MAHLWVSELVGGMIAYAIIPPQMCESAGFVTVPPREAERGPIDRYTYF